MIIVTSHLKSFQARSSHTTFVVENVAVRGSSSKELSVCLIDKSIYNAQFAASNFRANKIRSSQAAPNIAAVNVSMNLINREWLETRTPHGVVVWSHTMGQTGNAKLDALENEMHTLANAAALEKGRLIRLWLYTILFPFASFIGTFARRMR